jgi:Tfp pilus assembly protein PilP
MKAATTITTTILVLALGAGLASAQSPTIIQNTRNQMSGVSNHATAASNEALGKSQTAPATVSVKPAPAKGSAAASSTGAKTTKTAVAVKPAVAAGKAGHAKVAVAVKAAPKTAPKASAPVTAKAAASAPSGATAESAEDEQSVVPDSKAKAHGRDPFVSPVVSRAGGSGCSNGKKCLEIGTINLKGVVHSENGFIAVVSNNLNKAYFLRENDPVFDGYVVKITGDSIVFQETLQDRLGKSFTREVVKKLTTPAV